MLPSLALDLAEEYTAISLSVCLTIDVEEPLRSKAEKLTRVAAAVELAGDVSTFCKYNLPLKKTLFADLRIVVFRIALNLTVSAVT